MMNNTESKPMSAELLAELAELAELANKWDAKANKAHNAAMPESAGTFEDCADELRTHLAEIEAMARDAERWRCARVAPHYLGVYEGLASPDCGLELLTEVAADEAADKVIAAMAEHSAEVRDV